MKLSVVSLALIFSSISAYGKICYLAFDPVKYVATLDEAKSISRKYCNSIGYLEFHCDGDSYPTCPVSIRDIDVPIDNPDTPNPIVSTIEYKYQSVAYPNETRTYNCGTVYLEKFSAECDLIPDPTPTPTPTPHPGSTDTIRDDITLDSKFNAKSSSGVTVAVNGEGIGAKSDSQKTVGDPVNVSTGSMWHQETDFSLRGKTPATELYFKRTYISQPVLLTSGLGQHWFHNFQSKIYDLDLDNANALLWADEDANVHIFVQASNGIFQNPPGFSGSLVDLGDRYELTKKDKVKLTFTKNESIAPFGSLISITEPHGEKITLTYDNNLLVSAQTGLAGRILFTYNSDKLLTQVLRERDNLAYKFAYDSNKNLLSATDFNGNKTLYTYQSSDVEYLDGLMLSFQDWAGRVTSFQYDDKGRVTSETRFKKATRSYTYLTDDQGAHSTVMRDIDGQTTIFNFDSNYRLIKTTYPDNSVEKLIWGTKNFVTSTVDALGFTTNYHYDSHDNLSLIKKPNSEEATTLNYDQNTDQPVQITFANGAPINLNINQSTGDVLQVTRDGLSLQYQYDQFGNIVSINNGIATYSNETNTNGLYKKIFDARNPETLSYDSRGRIIKRQSQSGRIITYSYDNYDRVILMTDNSGPSVKYTYDVVGRVLQQEVFSSTNKEVTKYLWDERSRLIQTTDNLGRKTQYQYNASNSTLYVIDKPSAIIAPDGKTTVFRYDIMQRLVQKIEADGSVTKFEYNLRGDLVKITDAEGNSTMFTYDGNRRLVKKDAPTLVTNAAGVSSPSREITLYSYDDSDRLLQEEKQLNLPGAKKTVTNFVYDNLDRVIEKTVQKLNSAGDTEGSKTSTFTYDAILDADLLKTANNDIVSLTFEHEDLPPYKIKRAITKATDPTNPHKIIETDLSMTLDYSGEITLLKSINGSTILSSNYDSAGRLLKISSGNFLSSNGPVFESTIVYDNFGRKSSVTNSDGLKQILTYDQLSRLNSLAWTKNNVSDVTQKLVYDLAGNITNSKRENTEAVFGYDKVNQLISEYSQVQTKEFQYDKVGNRIKDSYLGNAKYISNAIIGDVKATNSFNTYGYDIDGLGNLTTIVSEKDKTQKDLTYDLNGKLETFQYSLGTNGDSLFATYYYDALDRRIAKNIQIAQGQTQKNFTQTYSYLGDEEKILFAKAGNGTFTLFVDGQSIDEHLGEVTSSTAKSYITDHLGSVLNTDASAGKKMFGAFGEKLSDVQLNALEINKTTPAVIYGYAGREYDLESGLYYNRARMYSADLGRFASRDPIGFNGGDENLYRYVGNAAVSYIDPSGLSEVQLRREENKILITPGKGVNSPPLLYPASNRTTKPNANPLQPEGNGPVPEGVFKTSKVLETGKTPNEDLGTAKVRIKIDKVLIPYKDPRQGELIHAGRANSPRGPGMAQTFGCIRTTEDAMQALRNDPPTSVDTRSFLSLDFDLNLGAEK